MSRSAFTIKVFAIYLLIVGPTLLLVPNLFLAAVSIAPTQEVWVRVVGVLAINIGVYYWTAAANELTPFFVVSVYTRLLVLASVIALVVVGVASSRLIPLGLIDALGALWTWIELRRGRREVPEAQPIESPFVPVAQLLRDDSTDSTK